MKDYRTKNNKGFRKRFAYGISFQLGFPMVGILLVVGFIIASTVFLLNWSAYAQDEIEFGYQIAQYATKEMQDYQAMDFLVEYWGAHGDEMDLIYDPKIYKEKELELRELWPTMPDLKAVNTLDIARKDARIQKMYAEVVYGNLSHDLSRIKRVFRPLYLYSFYVDDDKMHFLVTGTLENEKRLSQGGELFELGYLDHYERGAYEEIDYILDTNNAPDVPSLNRKWTSLEDLSVTHFFMPVFCHGKLVAILGVAVTSSEIFLNNIKVTMTEVVFMTLMFLCVALWLNIQLRRKIKKPLKGTETAVKRYEKEKDGAAVTEDLARIRPNNEIEALCYGFSTLVAELDRYVEEVRQISADKERIETELNVATKIQADMLPQEFPDESRFDLYATMDPAKEVGGDFYDFFMLDKDHIGLVIADVSGKGVPAALFMVIAKTLIKGRALSGGSPSEILYGVNNILCERNDLGYFVTVWFAIIDLRTGEGVSSNAGHEHPVIKPSEKQYEYRVYPHSPALGLIEDIRFKERQFKVEPGDRIFVYTDGVPEATNAEKQLFGDERLKEALDASDVNDPAGVCRKVREYIDEFVDGEEQFDDITMLTFRFKGMTGEGENASSDETGDKTENGEIISPEDKSIKEAGSKKYKTIVVEEITE